MRTVRGIGLTAALFVALVTLVLAGATSGLDPNRSVLALSSPVSADAEVTDLQTRVAAMETRVAKLETAVFADATPSGPSVEAEAAEIQESEMQRTVGGTALDLLPKGDAGSVVLVAAGPLDHGQIPLVIRNNTPNPVADATVKVEARDTSGTLVAVGETTTGQTLKPYILQPGDIAIGFASVPGEVPGDAMFSFAVDAEDAPGMMGDFNVDLVLDEASWLSDRIVGVARNPSDQTVGGTYMNLVCFGPDGMPMRAEPSTIQEDIEPDSTASFQIGGGLRDVSECERFLVAATAHPQH